VLGCRGHPGRVWDLWLPVSAGCREYRWRVLVMWTLLGRWGRVSCVARVQIPVVRGGCQVRTCRVRPGRGGCPVRTCRVRLGWWGFRTCVRWRGTPMGRRAPSTRLAGSRAVRQRNVGRRSQVRALGEPVWGFLVLVRAGPATARGGCRVRPGGIQSAFAGCGWVEGRMVVAEWSRVQVWRWSARGGYRCPPTGALMSAGHQWIRVPGDHPGGGPRYQQTGSTASNAPVNPPK
jgi:hypothetical protein